MSQWPILESGIREGRNHSHMRCGRAGASPPVKALRTNIKHHFIIPLPLHPIEAFPMHLSGDGVGLLTDAVQ